MRLCALLASCILFLQIRKTPGAMEINYHKQLEEDLLKSYNNKHRPVKTESSVVHVQIFISITHVEKVDEHEQTMMVHGHLWATWIDEYMTWDPAKYNDTDKINIDSWRLWQPALALYNSAKGNAWYLYMNGMPSIVTRDGKVWASGSFSFYVTCRFDFSDWPYDVQNCPIVISDWVYDLSRVNLSDPGETPWKNPLIKMNYDPTAQNEKKHISGWEVADSWRRHCYWGPSGCKEEFPDGQPEWYWSLLEFGVRLKRHAPYLGLMIILPTVVSCGLNLLTFWVDNLESAVILLISNIFMQGIFGWDLIRQLPPGSGSTPHIVTLYGTNLFLTAISFVIHVFMSWIIEITPSSVTLPLKMSPFTKNGRVTKFLDARGFSFDPQAILGDEESDIQESENHHSPLAIETSSTLEEQLEQSANDQAGLIVHANENPTTSTPEVVIPLDDIAESHPEISTEKPIVEASFEKQVQRIRRMIFLIFAFVYFILVPYGIY